MSFYSDKRINRLQISIKKIGGKQYRYASSYIYIDKGLLIAKNKSLGRVGVATDTEKRLEEFKNTLIKTEIEERVKYWEPKISEPKTFQYVKIERIEELRTKLNRKKDELGEIGKAAMAMAFSIDFIYNSNKIEGSRLPQKTVAELSQKGGNNEVANTIRAIDYFDHQKFPVSISALKDGQKILLAHEESKHGFRTEPMVVGNAELLDHKNIKKNLEELFAWYKEQESKIYPLELAFLFHYKFERIHPFPDGNGRVGRILMNAILKKHRFHPMIVWNTKRKSYFSSFEKAMNGNKVPYLRFMIEQYKMTYEKYLPKIEKASSFDHQLKEFLKPTI